MAMEAWQHADHERFERERAEQERVAAVQWAVEQERERAEQDSRRCRQRAHAYTHGGITDSGIAWAGIKIGRAGRHGATWYAMSPWSGCCFGGEHIGFAVLYYGVDWVAVRWSDLEYGRSTMRLGAFVDILTYSTDTFFHMGYPGDVTLPPDRYVTAVELLVTWVGQLVLLVWAIDCWRGASMGTGEQRADD